MAQMKPLEDVVAVGEKAADADAAETQQVPSKRLGLGHQLPAGKMSSGWRIIPPDE